MTRSNASAPRPRAVLAAIALGSNLGDRRAHLDAAFEAISRLAVTRVVARSGVRETAPVGPPQPVYLNAVALVETALPPQELLEELLRIERSRGRTRPDLQRWGPRTLDLDLLFHGDATIDTPGLVLPHPRLHERAFVLEPLAEVAGGWMHPRLGKTVSELWSELKGSANDRKSHPASRAEEDRP